MGRTFFKTFNYYCKRLLPIFVILGSFVKLKKLDVLQYIINLCNESNPYYDISLQGNSGYGLTGNFLIAKSLFFKLQFPVNKFMKSFSDITISHGYGVIDGLDNEDLYLNFYSLKHSNGIKYDIKINQISLEKVVQVFQLEKLEMIFTADIIEEFQLSSVTFLNPKISGYSFPSTGFEFQILGKVSGPQVFSDASKVFFILQQFKQEITLVKCLLYTILENQTAKTLQTILSLSNRIPKIPFMNPLGKKIAVTIANADIYNVNIEEFQNSFSIFFDPSSSKSIIREGVEYIYRLDSISTDSTNLTNEGKFHTEKGKISVICLQLPV